MRLFFFDVDNTIVYIYVSCYTIAMKNIANEYRRTATTVSLIRYHLVFCPRYRRKIFLIPGVENSFKTHTARTCKEAGIRILAMECHIDHVHMFVDVPPQMSIPEILKVIKGSTSHTLREEFPQLAAMPSLWTRSYFVSTAGNVSAETIQGYVETQKTRP